MKTLRDYMEVNFLGAVKVSQVFLPLLRRSRGRIVNMSSLAGLQQHGRLCCPPLTCSSPPGAVPVPLLAAYGASKAALALYSQVMRVELSAWGVQVSVIQPSGFRTSTFVGCWRGRETQPPAQRPADRRPLFPSDIFGNSDDISRHGDQLLAAVSSDVREDYGHAYISALPGVLTRMSQQSAADLSPVVDAMYHALLRCTPQDGWRGCCRSCGAAVPPPSLTPSPGNS